METAGRCDTGAAVRAPRRAVAAADCRSGTRTAQDDHQMNNMISVYIFIRIRVGLYTQTYYRTQCVAEHIFQVVSTGRHYGEIFYRWDPSKTTDSSVNVLHFICSLENSDYHCQL